LKLKEIIPIIAIVIAIIITVVVFTSSEEKTPSLVLLADKNTGKDTSYAIEILKLNEIQNKTVCSWVEESQKNPETNGESIYYTLYNRSNDYFDMYLFIPDAKNVVGNITFSNITITTTASALNLIIESSDDKTKESTDLIFHIFVINDFESATARTEQLYVDNKKFINGGGSSAKFD